MTLGIHHITALAADPARNVRFYTEVLGLRLVKKTVNFDDPGTYHLYFGDEAGQPGTILTFFPWPDLAKGCPGAGQVTSVAYAVPAGSLEAWAERLGAAGIEPERSERGLALTDPDGLALVLVEEAAAEELAWTGGPVPAAEALRGFAAPVLESLRPEGTVRVLAEHLGFCEVASEGGRVRLAAGEGLPHQQVEVSSRAGAALARSGAGTVHHIAFSVADDDAQGAVRRGLLEAGVEVTEVRDRQYFRSIYFREPGGILFEVATAGPGFAIDEPMESLGMGLKLPPHYEKQRAAIEAGLPQLA